ncbi:MAG: proline--tRNA ligase [archaeon]|nr:proline--tRNA ligase [archaeon]
MAKKENKTETKNAKELEKGIENIVKQITQAQNEPKQKKPLQPLIKIEHSEKENSNKTTKNISVEMLKGISVKKNENFSQWYTEVIEKCELADIRYNVKGFLVFQPWSVLSMEKMYALYEKALQKKGHKPYWYPTVIPEKNFKIESSHVKGFTPEVFWITEAGNDKFEEKLALRPTSETAFYQMWSLWIRSYKDLPFKTYQRANVFRYETKATRPFLRSREFYWLEAHDAHATKEDAMKQVKEDMQTTQEMLHDTFGLPFIFFERPAWDKFPGADRTFAADVLNPDGKVVQQPSTHLLSQEFSKGFNVKFKDKDEKEKYAWITCYGPAISRIFASIIIVHGDDKGLRFPFKIAPTQVVIVPIKDDEKLLNKAKELQHLISDLASVEIDTSEKSAGEKFNYWEMKGVPLRIDLGFKDLENKKITIFRRDINQKEVIEERNLKEYIRKISIEFDNNMIKQADKLFDSKIKDANNLDEIKNIIEEGSIARINFCSIDKTGEQCAEIIEKEVGAQVRGTKLEQEPLFGNKKCAICDKEAKEVVYIAKSY